MSDERLTTAAAAEKLGVPITTLKGWLSQVPVPADRDAQGRRRFPSQALEVLAAVRDLREDGRTFETIRRRIPTVERPTTDGPETDAAEHQADARPAADDSQTDARPTADARALTPVLDTSAIIEAVTAAISSQTDMAERFGKVAYELGEAKATIRALEADRDRLAGELAEARAAAARPARAWWKVWQ